MDNDNTAQIQRGLVTAPEIQSQQQQELQQQSEMRLNSFLEGQTKNIDKL